MSTPNSDYIWLEEAATKYGRSTTWLRSQVAAGVLTLYEIPGDKRRYLSRKQLEALLTPRPVDRDGSEQAQ